MIVFTLTLIGAASLSLSMRRHWEQALPRRDFTGPWPKLLRCLGFLLLVLAAILSCGEYGALVGLMILFGFLTAAILAVALVLAFWLDGPPRPGGPPKRSRRGLKLQPQPQPSDAERPGGLEAAARGRLPS